MREYAFLNLITKNFRGSLKCNLSYFKISIVFSLILIILKSTLYFYHIFYLVSHIKFSFGFRFVIIFSCNFRVLVRLVPVHLT